ncbi:MAG: sigma 54-interacting transcriptional regulator [Acidobacteria bacterium]|nr:sigma 54-interacting transcriptional regulator [Acidobacteriota bacterium]
MSVPLEEKTIFLAPSFEPVLQRMVGDSRPLREIKKQILRVARTDVTVLLQGESGTGKEIAAEVIHGLSRRAQGPWVRINCGAIPELLLESELFGHERGAYTGAFTSYRGKIRMAHGGTVLLDEISALSLAAQVKLLRLIQEGEVEPLGSCPVTVDVRIIATSNTDLWSCVRSGTFREDLYYRLAVMPIELPPLRERKEDVPALAEHFIRRFRRDLGVPRPVCLTRESLEALLRYDWPGNVRELENVIQHAMLAEDEDAIRLESLPRRVLEARSSGSFSLRDRLRELERGLLLEALERSHGVKQRAADWLCIDPRNLSYFLKKHRLQ